MSLRLPDLEFEYVEFPDLPESLEQALRDRAAEAGVPLSCFVASVIAQYVAKCEGDTCGDYRYSGLP
jgi:hypothetical protein